MALHGSASVNLSPILFKGNNRSLGINVIIHQDQSGSMDDVSLFYSTGEFIGELQQALLDSKIGSDERYPNLYSYFGVYSRNPSSSFTIVNSNGSLTVSQAFMKGLDNKQNTISYWTNNYFNNLTSHVVNICTNQINNTTGGRLTGYSDVVGGASPKSEDIHGNIWSIYTTPNPISTGTPGRYGEIIGSDIRKGSTTIIITNSDEQQGAPTQMINTLVDIDSSGNNKRAINGSTGEIIYRKYRLIGVNSYDIVDENQIPYDGILFYGSSTTLPYGLVKFEANNTYTITRSSSSPTINGTTAISGTELSPPTVSLTSNTNSIAYGGSVTLTWNSAYADNVISSSGFGFSNVSNLSGSLLIESLTEDTTYAITVANPIGAATSSVTVSVGNPTIAIPTVNLSSPTESPEGYVYVDTNGSVTLNWTSTNATSVVSSTGTGFSPSTVSGTATISNITTDSTFTITVQGQGGTVTSNEIKVLVKSPVVSLSLSNSTVASYQFDAVRSAIYANGISVFVGGKHDSFIPSGLPTINQTPNLVGKSILFKSSNGQDWDLVSPDVSGRLHDIAYGSSTFVAVGENGIILTSTDNWNTYSNVSISSSLSFTDFISVAYGSNINKFVATRYFIDNFIYISTDQTGSSWTLTEITCLTGPGGTDISSSVDPTVIRYLNGDFYMSSGGSIFKSSDAINWVRVYVGVPNIQNIIYDGSNYYAVAFSTLPNTYAIIKSSNGDTWTSIGGIPNNSIFPKYIASDGTNVIVTGDDSSGENINNTGLGNGDYLISSDSGNTWSVKNPTKDIRGPVVYDNSEFLILDSYTPSEYFAYNSVDGQSFSSSGFSLRYEVDPNFILGDSETGVGIRTDYFSPRDSLGRFFSVSINPNNFSGNLPITTTQIGNKTFRVISGIQTSIITAYLQSPVYGGSSILTWNSSNATSVLSSSGSGFNPISLSGSITVTPTTTTTYSITVQNSLGETSRATETVELPLLNSGSPLPTISLSSDKASVGIGETFSLTWTSTNAETVSSVAGFGFTAGATSGSTLVTAGINSTYTVTVQSPSGITTSNSVPITINAPTVTLSSDKISTDLNSPVKLTWNSTNAVSVASSTGSGFAPTEASGSALVYPTSNTTYSITVRGSGGITTSNTVPVTINAPTVFFIASVNTIVPENGYLVLNWISTNATSVSSFSGTGFNPTQVSGYAIIQNITGNRTYSITVSGPSGTATASINVTINTNSTVSVSSQQLHNTILLALESRGGIFSINRVFTNAQIDNRVAFSKCLAEFIENTV